VRIVDSLLNRSEETVLHELQNIASDNAMRVFTKPRLSDVIRKDTTRLTNREFDFYTRSHFDFVITDDTARPLMVVEYDGPLHQSSAEQRERDEIKNELCRRAGLGLLRINDRYVTRLYRGMTVLRWIIEVIELQKAFNAAQDEGQIPWDESFDPAFLEPAGAGGRFPYWLGASATQSFHKFFKTLERGIPKGWSGILGEDDNGAARRLSCLYFGDRVLWTTTGIRKQDLDFPDYDLLSELDTCELGILLKRFRSGEVAASSPKEFRPVFERFCERYRAHPSHSMGAFPFEGHWSSTAGWRAARV
jgi:very-short-patch-repair endonuclease